MIQLDQVSKVYQTAEGPVRALDGVSLNVNRGEFVGVRGPSGCGKSTLLTLVGGLGTPTSGRVVVDGQNFAELSSSARAQFRARRVGFVFQMFHLLPYLTVLDNVVVAALPDKRSKAGDHLTVLDSVPLVSPSDGHAKARDHARELLDRFGLSHRLTHRPAELSIGERQRVAMARALVNRPDVVLADEPTGNLDPDNATIVLELLADFHRSGGTVLLVTHDDRAATYSDRGISLHEGRLVDAPAP